VCGQNACAPFNGGWSLARRPSNASSTSRRLLQLHANRGCLDDVLFSDVGHECSDVAGTAVRGPEPALRERSSARYLDAS